MDDTCLKSIENRIESLEGLIFGTLDKDIVYPKDNEQALDALAQINARVNSAIAGKTAIENVMHRLSEIENYMDPAYTEKFTLSLAAKADMILAEEELICTQAANLEKIQSMTDVLNSEHIKALVSLWQAVPSLQGRLHELSQINISTQDSADELISDTKNLLVNYNNVIQTMSRCFVMWDEILTDMEAEAQRKPAAD